jgi:glycerate kinase
MIVIAPDSFKGTLTAIEVCKIIESGFIKVSPELEIKCVPIADGGEGTVDAMLFNGGRRVFTVVKDPYFNDIDACFGILDDNTAVIEMAAASGLPLVGENKNPMLTTTYGTGQLILKALDCGCKKILLGIGGSATNDGGIGCVAALGGKFTDNNGIEVPLCGKGLEAISNINLKAIDKRIENTEIEVLCDVTSPLYGENGAAYVFAPQKGADENEVKALDDGLRHLSEVTLKTVGEDNSQLAGAGAAGGLGFGLISFLNARTVSGARAVLNAMNFEELAKKAELVITGEGCMDEQSLLGKAPAQAASMAGNTPVIAIVGASKINDAGSVGIKKIYVSNYRGRKFEDVVKYCREDLDEAAQRAARDFKKNIFSTIST